MGKATTPKPIVAHRSSARKSADAAILANSIRAELEKAGSRDIDTREEKKNYAEVLSRELSTRFANALRPTFAGILPDEEGKGQESRARTSKGYKKLDVNYSTSQLGLGLGVSIKTINFRDGKSKRYTKNYTRVDGELRAEASDYHVRQPYATMVAIIFLPLDACDDAARDPSSFGQAIQLFRRRCGRDKPTDDPMLFERVFVGLYDTRPASVGDVSFFDVRCAPPKAGPPKIRLKLADVIENIIKVFDDRNDPPFEWDTGEVETDPLILEDVEEDDAED